MAPKQSVYEMSKKDPSKPRSRWPFTSYPKSWFMVEHSEALQVGEVKALQYFGKDLVLFRGEDGTARVFDAFCPHMGAHLGYGGQVEGNEIRCPFHAWKFQGDGVCSEVPYASKIPKRARVKAWNVCEANGFILVWNDIEEGAPQWEINELDEIASGEWSPLENFEWKIKSHCLDMGENQVDTAHFQFLHGVPEVPENQITIDGPVFGSRSETEMTTPSGLVASVIDSKNWGFGFARVIFSGLTDLMILNSMTPIDGERVHVRFDFLVKSNSSADPEGGVGRAFMEEVVRQFTQDINIWEHKIYLQPPNLCDGDGPVSEYRRWAAQFFPGGTIAKSN